MVKKKRLLTAVLQDGYVKTIGPTSIPFTHYWHVVAELESGKTEVLWGHVRSRREVSGKEAALAEPAKQRGWRSYTFEVVELTGG